MRWSTCPGRALFHYDESRRRDEGLEDAEPEYDLRIRPALVLAEVVVQRGADILERIDVQEADGDYLDYAHQTVKAKHTAHRDYQKGVARLEHRYAKEKSERP